MALPETDLHRIRLWARERVPEHLWDQLKVEADVSDRHVDIVEVRAAAVHAVDRPVGDLLARPQPRFSRVQAQAPDEERPSAPRPHRDEW